MAKNTSKIYLGFEDESVNEKNQTLLSHKVNKIGGYPDWPPLNDLKFPSKCPMCGLNRLLITQCYAPLEGSVYHRSLYIFACISPNCWNQSEGWICVRSQIKDEKQSLESSPESATAILNVDSTLAWCSGADDWDENDNGDVANGNFMNVDNVPGSQPINRASDDEDESNSLDVDTVDQAFGSLKVHDTHNANSSPVQGAGWVLGTAVPAAEFEGGDEPGLVTVDTPTKPAKDLQNILYQTAELPGDLRSRLLANVMQFPPKFVYVEEEQYHSSRSEDHVAELLSRYKQDTGEDIEMVNKAGGEGGCAGADEEQYEEAAPAHGDKLFHNFVTRLKLNPGQILRYSRDSPPLLGAPIASSPSTAEASAIQLCSRCGATKICELQLLPAFGAILQLPGHPRLDYLQFLSVLVFTCQQSCWNPEDRLVRETVVFQPEML